ncbi:alpha/beta hydrolase [Polaribacter sp.]|uniref:alpha/beta fold hydrolase n=1 Tax=Polaribacter sp. TaxID=1920175 RepID=UPI0025EF4616|nr:alpha/beta hydrolase [Polaribacter sp.]
MEASDWKKKGKFYDFEGKSIFVIDEGTSNDVLVILHGYPTSSFDYHKVLPELVKKYRVIIHDHLGFGFSDKPLNYSYSLIEQADLALQLWEKLNLKTVTLLAHDYGTSVATEILARLNINLISLKIKELILCNGSIHIEYSKLRVIQKLLKNKFTGKLVAKLSTYRIFKENIKKTYFDKNKVSEKELMQMWFQIENNNGRKVIHKLTNYINERYYFWYRWVGALEKTTIPTKIIWAKNDPIAVPKIGKLIHEEVQNSNIFWLEKCGHFLMLEKPNEFSLLVLKS